eukprot:1194198-Prorocentrum_minimum.AAC.1
MVVWSPTYLVGRLVFGSSSISSGGGGFAVNGLKLAHRSRAASTPTSGMGTPGGNLPCAAGVQRGVLRGSGRGC